ncbi:universal stress protein [Amphiplicatus metriothermophilus]|uniref:Nucleotide-binding universal stress protein, UspA family n=1 Tax=Amphiplicatus metriothermophilus TaxID=1519374 RepID=A0A239PJK7_9PROT|nr:universal stress protein [Amphiplicatus metriothermophilus]MBB5517690.1 nucleotide-binding universal stress UspA family protein [Amphiplicatus metriothermophilus]SNT67976.1 Nucleotide-binding universal stress protein, UspA family [Amphiplicatus metriothermophilus]
MTEEKAGGPPETQDDRLKFLLIAHDCPEARLAAYFTARRAKRSNARVALLHVIEPPEFGHWATVADTMREEALEAAEAVLAEFAAIVAAEWGEQPEAIIREGRMVDEIRKLIEEDPKIAILFLGASADPDGPGPLVSALAKGPSYLGARPIPVTVVPGSLSREDLRRIS